MEKTYTQLDQIAVAINNGEIGLAKAWGGAGVGIVSHAPELQPGGFYPDPQYVVTPHVGQLSWLFETLVDVAKHHEGFGMWKEDFFIRLATRAQAVPVDAEPRDLLLASLIGAYEFFGEIESGELQVEVVVVHPRTPDAGAAYDGTTVRSFFASRGLFA